MRILFMISSETFTPSPLHPKDPKHPPSLFTTFSTTKNEKRSRIGCGAFAFSVGVPIRTPWDISMESIMVMTSVVAQSNSSTFTPTSSMPFVMASASFLVFPYAVA